MTIRPDEAATLLEWLRGAPPDPETMARAVDDFASLPLLILRELSDPVNADRFPQVVSYFQEVAKAIEDEPQPAEVSFSDLSLVRNQVESIQLACDRLAPTIVGAVQAFDSIMEQNRLLHVQLAEVVRCIERLERKLAGD